MAPSSIYKIPQTNKQNRLKQSLLRHFLFILFNLIIYTTKVVTSPVFFSSRVSVIVRICDTLDLLESRGFASGRFRGKCLDVSR